MPFYCLSMFCRLDVEKIRNNQANLESKELAVLLVSLFFAGLATLKLVSARLSTFFRSSQSDQACRTYRGWVLILVSSSMTIFVTLLSSQFLFSCNFRKLDPSSASGFGLSVTREPGVIENVHFSLPSEIYENLALLLECCKSADIVYPG